MKKICAALIFAVMLVSLAVFAVFSSSEDGEDGGRISCTGIISKVSDINGDGFLDADGEIRIMLLAPNRAGFIMLGFSEAEFDDMALCEGKSKKVSTAAGAYAVNTVLSMEYCGDTALLEKNSLTAADTVNLKKGFTAACFENGEDARDTVLPDSNELYSTYLNYGIGKRSSLSEAAISAGFSAEYDAEKDSAKITYKGVTYTVTKKLFHNEVENPIVVTENGEEIDFCEIPSKVKSLAEGEMLALFGDVKQDSGEQSPVFELLDIKSSRGFAPVSAEFNPYSGILGEARSYIIWEREARASVPEGRVFSSRASVGSGLSLVLAPQNCKAGYYENIKLYKNRALEEFENVSCEKIVAAEDGGDYIKVKLESGRQALLPSAKTLESKETQAEFFYELFGSVASVKASVNTAQSSWFSSLESFLAENKGDIGALEGSCLTAALGEEGRAVFAELS